MQIDFMDVDYVYQRKSPVARQALYEVNLQIKKGEFTAIIGKTGSGKSTSLQHFNALLLPTSGKVLIGELELASKFRNKNLYELRRQVGVVFQFPENQLFEETVEADIGFGPLNYGASKEECHNIVRDVVKKVGLNENILSCSPFELSGGQKRRVAIAGILAMDPEVIVLDEPTVGLDPKGCLEIMTMLYNYQQNKKCTMVFVTHSMEDVASYAKNLIVMEQGRVIIEGDPQDVFFQYDKLKSLDLELPKLAQLQLAFEKKTGHVFPKRYFVESEFVEAVCNYREKLKHES